MKEAEKLRVFIRKREAGKSHIYFSPPVQLFYTSYLGSLVKSKVCRKFDPRTNYHVKMDTYIPDIQVRPHPCILSRILLIVFKNPVNINCCIFHCHLSVTQKRITDSFTAFSYPYFQLVCIYSEIIFIILSLNFHVTIFFVM